jgi:glycosyltransferase involved in cell wall biosynthesis
MDLSCHQKVLMNFIKLLKKVIVSEELRNQMGSESRKLVEEKFSKEVVNRETLKVYDSF